MSNDDDDPHMSNDNDPYANSQIVPAVQIIQLTPEEIEQYEIKTEQRNQKELNIFKSRVTALGDPNRRSGPRQVTALHFATITSSIDKVKYLVETYPDLEIDPQDTDGSTPLFNALSNVYLTVSWKEMHDDNVDIVKYLVDHGANVHLTPNNGCSCLHMAAMRYNLTMVKYFLDKGIDKNKLWNGKTTVEMLKDDKGLCKQIIEYINAYEPVPTKGVNDGPAN